MDQCRPRLRALVDLPKRFSNSHPALKSLIRRVLKGSEGRGPRSRAPERRDMRGLVAQNPAKAQTRLTPERRAELVADYVAGMPVRAIATKYGVHRGTIPTLVRRAGAEVRAAGLDAEESKLASSRYENGMTLAQVAAQMGISDEAVRQAVLNHGGQIRPKGRRPRR
jgi:DNA-directed RNA polymerase specialized sigma24 family protein